jgi:hypothetical protein
MDLSLPLNLPTIHVKDTFSTSIDPSRPDRRPYQWMAERNVTLDLMAQHSAAAGRISEMSCVAYHKFH